MSQYQNISMALLLLAAVSCTDAFVVGPPIASLSPSSILSSESLVGRWASTDNKETTSAFVPLEGQSSADDDDEDDDDEDTLEKAELLGKGAAKVKRGKRKGTSASSTTTKVKTNLAPEETFYEGPPAITETIAPTLSILTVIGIIPAAAAWARQAWVRYKITNRRIRVTSGIGGKEMAEIVYPDIVELRTAKRLFGDGDLVAFLRDGAKFEMRNIPNFDDTIEFILQQVDKDVATQYQLKGDVTKPPSQ